MTFFSATRESRISLFSSATRAKKISLVKASGLKGCSFCLSRRSIFSRSSILPEVCFSVPSGLKNLMVLPVYDSYARICSLSSFAIATSPGTIKKGSMSKACCLLFSNQTLPCGTFSFSIGRSSSDCKRNVSPCSVLYMG